MRGHEVRTGCVDFAAEFGDITRSCMRLYEIFHGTDQVPEFVEECMGGLGDAVRPFQDDLVVCLFCALEQFADLSQSCFVNGDWFWLGS